MKEIYYNGPVTVSFKVYEDFFFYKSGVLVVHGSRVYYIVYIGVYQYVTGSFKGQHAVKILGWGIENGTPFWLAANSWNTDWGDEGIDL